MEQPETKGLEANPFPHPASSAPAHPDTASGWQFSHRKGAIHGITMPLFASGADNEMRAFLGILISDQGKQ